MTSKKHWGEFLDDSEGNNPPIPDIRADIERSMTRNFLNKMEEDSDCTPKVERIRVPPLNPVMTYTISLHGHINKIAKLIADRTVDSKIALDVPKMPKFVMKHSKNSLNFAPQDFTDFTTGVDVDVPDLSRNVVRQILTKSVATLFAHVGYQECEESALNVLTDVVEDFFRKISHHTRNAMLEEDKSAFPNAIERVLSEMGMGGVKGLDDYYQHRVLKYIKVLQTRCKRLNEEYLRLCVPTTQSPVDSFNLPVKVKEEEEDVVEADNPEVHFPANDSDVSYPILEAGYQLLNGLEAVENLQVMGGESGASAGGGEEQDMESPGVVSISSESDISHLSPYAAKKSRFK